MTKRTPTSHFLENVRNALLRADDLAIEIQAGKKQEVRLEKIRAVLNSSVDVLDRIKAENV